MKRVDILFAGPTGTGKSTLLDIIQRLIKNHTTMMSCTQTSEHCLKIVWDQLEEVIEDGI